jgi:hypothetical protein
VIQKGKSSDLVLGFHCFSVDVIMAFCYVKNWDATKAPDFEFDILAAQEARSDGTTCADSDSTSIAATTVLYHVLHKPEVRQRLVKELRTAWPVLEEVPHYEVFEKRYLT